MKYRITRHSTAKPPADALELLSAGLGPRRAEVSFKLVAGEIRATVHDDDAPVAMTHDERTDIGRRAVLEAVRDVCERVPELKLDWYAVSPAG